MTTASGNLYVISAPSGAGKTSLTRKLVEQLNHPAQTVAFSISTTTRAARPGETHGVDYLYVDKPQFQEQINQAAFLEHAQVFGNYYGTSQAQVELELKKGRDVILEIDWQGAQQVRKQAPNCISIFILPPSRAELERRLRSRGQDSDDVINGRMREAVNEMAHFAEFDYLVINDYFDLALSQLNAIFQANRVTQQAQAARSIELIGSLLA
ncbi:MAG: guanylate kinase [Gammaproteobacteria bacterium]|jgi:guanylate kinase